MKSDKGVILFAHNNEQIDYVLIAIINCLMIKKNLKLPVQLITDSATLTYAEGSDYAKYLKYFDEVTLVDIDYDFYNLNKKNYRDTDAKMESLPFYNKGRHQAYQLSIFEESILVDADYLIMSDRLNLCFGSENSVMINSKFSEIVHSRKSLETCIDEFSIPLWWATSVYFKKDEIAERFFQIVKDVEDEKDYYGLLYLFPRNLFRNDFAFSIARHVMNGNTNYDIVTDMPTDTILKSTDSDDVINIGYNSIKLLAKNNDGHIVTEVKDVDLHVMNKWALVRHAKKFLETYE